MLVIRQSLIKPNHISCNRSMNLLAHFFPISPNSNKNFPPSPLPPFSFNTNFLPWNPNISLPLVGRLGVSPSFLLSLFGPRQGDPSPLILDFICKWASNYRSSLSHWQGWGGRGRNRKVSLFILRFTFFHLSFLLSLSPSSFVNLIFFSLSSCPSTHSLNTFHFLF